MSTLKARLDKGWSNEKSLETKAKSLTYKVITPLGDTLKITNLIDFAKKHGISESMVYAASNGHRSEAKGYVILRQETDN